MAHVSLTSLARADLDAIWAYIAKDNLSAADRLIDQVLERCRVFATQPQAATPGDRFHPGRATSQLATMWSFFGLRTTALSFSESCTALAISMSFSGRD
jgi:plasmid stabilization system protein ParE